ncbi:MmcB family DNA repair protein [Halalkalibacterium halodurans]|uniref:Uncharacterized protein n=1 Tax=Halalkalibacterium halodurans TaxID=86665 RepID=A0A0M0KMS1_ALKHA|nr:MmcB family DNA repair protein [Halalkalibacterium halodurans]
MNVRADLIKRALSKKHHQDFFLTEVKNGPTHFASELAIIDALAIKKSWAKPCITGYEVKVSRQDFLNDSKWPVYKDMCHRFNFACPKGLISPDEVPEDVGLIWFNPETGALYTRKKSKFREIEMHADMLYYILMSRVQSDRHPFFSDEREEIEAFMQDKTHRRYLANVYENKLAKQAEQAIKEAEQKENEAEKVMENARRFERVVEIMKNNGIKFHRWTWEEELDEALKHGMPRDFRMVVAQLERDVESLKNIAGNDNK